MGADATLSSGSKSILKSELACWIGIATATVFMTVGQGLLGRIDQLGWFVLLFVWLFSVMLWLSFSVVRHADGLAVLLGEPYGTLILTLAVISIEVVMIAAVMVTGASNPTLARDTMFAVLTLVLPRFTPSAPDGQPSRTLAWLLIAASVVLYGVFLGIQTMRHRHYFVQPDTDGDENGKLYWESATGTVTKQPACSGGQRVSDFFFRLLPIENQL